MIKHLMKGTPGWWLLHAIVLPLIFWLGAVTRFAP